MRLPRLIALGLAATVVAGGGSVPARADGITCGQTTRIYLDGPETLTLVRGDDDHGSWLYVSLASDALFARCDLAYIDEIVVTVDPPSGMLLPSAMAPADAAEQTVILDLAGGPLGPGMTPEYAGIDEIEIEISLGQANDEVIVYGTPGADRFRAGSDGVDLNGDGDVDLTIRDVERMRMYGRRGADTLDAGGGAGTGGPATVRLSLVGGGGRDVLRGGAAEDTLSGGRGADTLDAADGVADSVSGGRGWDSATVDAGLDEVSSAALIG